MVQIKIQTKSKKCSSLGKETFQRDLSTNQDQVQGNSNQSQSRVQLRAFSNSEWIKPMPVFFCTSLLN